MMTILYIEFPITGPLRFILLVMEWILSFLCFQLGVYFILRYKKRKSNQLENFQDLGFFSLFMGFSLTRFFFLISSYYSSDIRTTPFSIWLYGSYRLLFLDFGFLSLMMGILFFTYFMEKYEKVLFLKYFFSICFLIQFILSLVLFFFILEPLFYLLVLHWFFFIVFSIIYNLDFIRKVKIHKIIQRAGLKITLIMSLFIGGYILSMDELTEFLGLQIRLLAIIIQLIAIILIFSFFRNIPPFYEFNWRDKIESIFIMNKDGICLSNRFYTDAVEIADRFLITGSLTSVNIMLNEIVNPKDYDLYELSIIKKKGKIINIFTAEKLIGVLISKEELEFFKYNLKSLVLKIEQVYANILAKWDGDLSIFTPIGNFIDEIFPSQ
jgi:hypothetical protein